MNIRQVMVSESDKHSARVFFHALSAMYDLSKADVLDAFARNGQLTVSSYYGMLGGPNSLTCWELAEEHRSALEQFTDNVKIGCSYELAKNAILEGNKYDVVVIDTPQGLHRTDLGGTATEHFDFLLYALRLLKHTGVLVLYVNKQPYNKNETGSHGYDEYAEYDFDKWMERRTLFYGDPHMTEERAIRAYRNLVEVNGFVLKNVIMVPCFSDVPGKDPYAFRLALEVERVN